VDGTGGGAPSEGEAFAAFLRFLLRLLDFEAEGVFSVVAFAPFEDPCRGQTVVVD